MAHTLFSTRFSKILAWTFIIILVQESCFPLVAMALTGGPSQPEVQSFEPAGTNQMVDLFSGDFNYNIPLLTVGNYPINLAYHAGVGMDQEASWVGLGWNINAGTVNRQKRGVPDDFNQNDYIKKVTSMKPNRTVSLDLGKSLIKKREFFGVNLNDLAEKINDAGFDVPHGNLYYNNYKGVGIKYSVTKFEKGPLSVGMGFDNQSGFSISPSLSFSKTIEDTESTTNGNSPKSKTKTASISSSYNSRSGLQCLSFGYDRQSNMALINKRPNKQINNLGGFGSSASISFANPTHTPSVSPSMRSGSYSFNLAIGNESRFKLKARNIAASFSFQGIKDIEKTYKPIGYLYADQQDKYSDAMYDINRENDQGISEYSNYVGLPNQTYDIYSVSGQGVGGMFRPHRNGVGILSDPEAEIAEFPINGVDLGLEFGLGAGVPPDIKIGADITVNFNYGNSGNWDASDKNAGLKFRDWDYNGNKEAVYLKRAGELTRTDNVYNNLLGGEDPVDFQLVSAGVESHSKKMNTKLTKYHWNSSNSQVGTDLSVISNTTGLSRNARDKRSSPYIHLTADEAVNHAVIKNIESYIPHQYTDWPDRFKKMFLPSSDKVKIPRNSGVRKGNHISEVSAINAEGTRYIYGIPAYNTLSKDVSFNVSGRTVDGNKGLVTYTEGLDNTTSNKRGSNNLYTSEEISPYAHSYLLTSVLASNYIDKGQDGPTDDDIGDFTKINYSRVYKDYKWRTPYTKANYNEGFISDKNDDMGTYSYGEKEVWYMHSIESKTHKAIFEISERLDGFEVKDENGEIGPRSLKKLKYIKLFTKNELKMAEIEGRAAVPIKTVHFDYTYQLCPGIDNSGNSQGKLTLTKVYFTYGTSSKGALSPYIFTYASTNPGYHPKGYDRWGNYMKENYHGFTNGERPYVVQNSSLVNSWASAWCMTKITMPSGGKINIEYESDDYAYVQDRKAMQMTNILGFGEKKYSSSMDNTLFDHHFMRENQNRNYIFFSVPSGSNINDYCPDDMEYIFANCKVDLTNKGDYEYVKSHYLVDHTKKGISGSIGYVYLTDVSLKGNVNNGKLANPIAKRAWQFARMNRSELVYPGSSNLNADDPVISVAKSLVAVLPEVVKMTKGFNRALRDKNYGNKVDLTHSWVRLNNPNGHKKGGGHRVKKIYLQDDMEGTKIYGQEYDYTMLDDKTGKSISSGVAAYEPMLGGDENPFREILKSYTIKNKLAPNDFMYDEGPIGESFFPGASIGYRKVTVKNITPANITRHATGKTVSEFYTAYDFPTLTDNTSIKGDFSPKFKLSKLLGFSRNFATASQGYSIELNDMHGKPKAEWSYAENSSTANAQTTQESPLSGVEYKYNTLDDNPKRLNSTTKILTKSGNISTADLGKEIDLTVDARQSEVNSGSGGAKLNLDIAWTPAVLPLIPPIPIPAFTIFPTATSFYNRTRIVGTTKVIQKYGIQTKTIVHKNGASLSTENIAFDEETGDVLLSKTENEYGNHNYSTKIPAHWVQNNEGMGPAYKNINTRVLVTSAVSNGKVSISSDKNLVPGDELIQSNGSTKFWVLSKKTGEVHLIDKNGASAVIAANTEFKVIRSGRRNLIGVTAASYTHQDDALINSGKYVKTNNSSWQKVVSASAVEYVDEWQMPQETQGGCHYKFEYDLWVKHYHEMILELIQNKDIFFHVMSTNPFEVTLYENGKYFHGYDKYLLNIHQSNTSTAIGKVIAEINPNNCFVRASSNDYEADEGLYCAIRFKNTSGNDITTINGNTSFNVKYPYDKHKKFMYYTPSHYNDPCTSCGISGYMGSSKSKFEAIYAPVSTVQSPRSFTGWNFKSSLGYPCNFISDPVSLYGQNLSYVAYADFVDHLLDNQTFVKQTVKDNDGPLNNYSSSTYKSHGNSSTYLPDYEDGRYVFDASGHILYHEYKAFYNYGQDSIVVKIDDRGDCQSCTNANTIVNPYQTGLKGNWQVKRSYAYFDKVNPDRTSKAKSYTNKIYTDMENDGFYPSSFKNYYKAGSSWSKDTNATSKWTWTNEITQMNSEGLVVEGMNADSNYSAQLYSHAHNNLVVASANNARRNEIAFNGFEDDNDIAYAMAWSCPTDRHLDFVNMYGDDVLVAEGTAHTGNYSLQVKAGKTGSSSMLTNVISPTTYASLPNRSYGALFNVQAYNKISGFSLETNKKYVLSYWVKADNTDTKIRLRKNGCSSGSVVLGLTSLNSNSPTIDGWKKIEQEFKADGSSICIQVYNTGSGDGYLDDIRIFPKDANMKSYVYEPYSLRLWAEMDENNYATFYEYDEAGKLVRVKKETERGIQTLQENRSGTKY